MALDEVIRMVTGLAIMTGTPGHPMRTCASVIDILAGTFGVIGIFTAILEQGITGIGQKVQG